MAKTKPTAAQLPVSDPLAYLHQLQDQAENGYHRELRAWVDNSSSVARVLTAYTDQLPAQDTPR